MAQSVSAVVCDKWREKLASIYAGDTSFGSFSRPLYFRIGEGGWEEVAGVKQPKIPDPTRVDIEADGVDPECGFRFTKALTESDLIFVSPTRLQIRCVVSTTEANSDLIGSPPEFYELGVYDYNPDAVPPETGVMLLYSTFPVEIKTDSKTLQHVVYVDF